MHSAASTQFYQNFKIDQFRAKQAGKGIGGGTQEFGSVN